MVRPARSAGVNQKQVATQWKHGAQFWGRNGSANIVPPSRPLGHFSSGKIDAGGARSRVEGTVVFILLQIVFIYFGEFQ